MLSRIWDSMFFRNDSDLPGILEGRRRTACLDVVSREASRYECYLCEHRSASQTAAHEGGTWAEVLRYRTVREWRASSKEAYDAIWPFQKLT